MFSYRILLFYVYQTLGTHGCRDPNVVLGGKKQRLFCGRCYGYGCVLYSVLFACEWALCTFKSKVKGRNTPQK